MKIHAINLSRSTDRLAALRRANSHLKDLVRFEAVDGSTIDREQLIREGLIASDLDYPDGTLGCALSHIALWRLAVASQSVVTIAEDDAIFNKDFELHAGRLQSIVGEWDFILWGASLKCYQWLNILPAGTGARLQFFEGDVLERLGEFQQAAFEPVLVPASYLLGLMCYSVTPRSAQLLLDVCLPLRRQLVEFSGFGVRLQNTGIDVPINAVLKDIKSYACLPPLILSDERQTSVRIAADTIG